MKMLTLVKILIRKNCVVTVVVFLLICVVAECNTNSSKVLSKVVNISNKCTVKRTWGYMMPQNTLKNKVCCLQQHFRVRGMPSCRPWLTCSDLKNVQITHLIGFGAVKAVYRGEWRGVEVALSMLNNVEFRDDFHHGIKMLRLLNPSVHVVQLLGVCEESDIFLTEYHELGNAVHITSIAERSKDDNVVLRLKLCLNYVSILNYLHNSPVGRRVFCDSNSLTKLLSQLLVTSDGSLVLNDVDALPEVHQGNDFKIKCGQREIAGLFVAPEQRWPFEGIEFHDSIMVGYDEKTDIWKVPAVCNHFIGTVDNGDVAKYNLFSMHKKCRNVDSKMRPTAENLVAEYTKIMNEFESVYI